MRALSDVMSAVTPVAKAVNLVLKESSVQCHCEGKLAVGFPFPSVAMVKVSPSRKVPDEKFKVIPSTV